MSDRIDDDFTTLLDTLGAQLAQLPAAVEQIQQFTKLLDTIGAQLAQLGAAVEQLQQRVADLEAARRPLDARGRPC